MRKTLIAAVCAVSLVATMPIASAHDTGHRHHHGSDHHSKHGHRHNHSDVGIAVAIGAAALIAAAASAKAHENSDVYQYHHGYGSRDNAIAACLHKAQRRVARRGGHGVTIKRVRRANYNGSSWDVRLAIKSRWPGRVRRNNVARCDVVANRVRNFRLR